MIQNRARLFQDLKRFPGELKHRDPILFYFGTGLLGLFFISVVFVVICQYTIIELCHWLKPGKFALSFAFYAFSMGWYLYYLKETVSNKILKTISWLIALVIVLDMILMLVESGLKLPNEMLFYAGNGLVLVVTAITFYVTVQFFKPISLKPQAYLWSIRFSFVLFLLSCLLGLAMMLHYGQVDPDPENLNIPFTQLSSMRANLISLHFVGVHAIQLIPFFIYYLHSCCNSTSQC